MQGNNLVRAVGSTTGDVPLARQYHLDSRGTVAATSLGSQALETRYSTDAFGNVLEGSAADNPAVYLGGLGYWEEPELSLQYVRNRWLNNATGTWLSVDSVATEPRYLYVGNRPTTATDPSGLESLWDQVKAFGEKHIVRPIEHEITHLEQHFNFHALIMRAFPEYLQFELDPVKVIKPFENIAVSWYRRKVMAVADDLSPYLNRIPGQLPLPTSFGIVSRNEWIRLKAHLPQFLQAVYPPYLYTPDGIRWNGGFIAGIAKSIAETYISNLTSFGTEVGELHTIEEYYNIASDIIHALGRESILQFIMQSLKSAKNILLNLYHEIANAEPFEQGMAIGALCVNAVTMIALFMTGLGAIADVINFIREGGDIVELLNILRTKGFAEAKKYYYNTARGRHKVDMPVGTTQANSEHEDALAKKIDNKVDSVDRDTYKNANNFLHQIKIDDELKNAADERYFVQTLQLAKNDLGKLTYRGTTLPEDFNLEKLWDDIAEALKSAEISRVIPGRGGRPGNNYTRMMTNVISLYLKWVCSNFVGNSGRNLRYVFMILQ